VIHGDAKDSNMLFRRVRAEEGAGEGGGEAWTAACYDFQVRTFLLLLLLLPLQLLLLLLLLLLLVLTSPGSSTLGNRAARRTWRTA